MAVQVGGALNGNSVRRVGRTVHNTGTGPIIVGADNGQQMTLRAGESITLGAEEESDTRPGLVKRDFQARLYLALEDWWDRHDLAECNVLAMAEGIADDMCVKDWDGVALRPGPAGWVDVFWNGYHCGAVDLVGTRDEVQRRHGCVSARAVAAASVAASKAAADEQEALRRELATPPRGYTTAAWQAYLCSFSEGPDGRPLPALTAETVMLMRASIESGDGPEYRIPERIVHGAAATAGPRPGHSYRGDPGARR